MSVQLLDKTRKINKLLHNNTSEVLIFDASETVRTFVNVLSDSEQMPVVVEYQIVSDSILLTSANGVDWEEAGVLRKLADSYDYLQWVTYEEDGEQVVLTLHKQLQQFNME